tara:strand:+ start:3622 stop:4449 length:828 start_codon:yes stop_codon:yes gene_type:complete
MLDTWNEDDDTYRFKSDCESWYGCEIENLSTAKFSDIFSVWEHYKSLNVARGAICSSVLKRDVRLNFEKNNSYCAQVFGFEDTPKERKRAKALEMNWPKSQPVFPLITLGMSKQDCLDYVANAGIEVPRAYKMGFHNNNCLNTGCIQGGIGYWQKMRDEFPLKFQAMAEREHHLSSLKGKPVTMLKDQGKAAKESGKFQVFLKPNPEFPEYKSLSDMKGRPVLPLMECNGFCGSNDLLDPEDRNDSTFKELNRPQVQLDFLSELGYSKTETGGEK